METSWFCLLPASSFTRRPTVYHVQPDDPILQKDQGHMYPNATFMSADTKYIPTHTFKPKVWSSTFTPVMLSD